MVRPCQQLRTSFPALRAGIEKVSIPKKPYSKKQDIFRDKIVAFLYSNLIHFVQLIKSKAYQYQGKNIKRIWNQLKSILSNNINFSISTPQSAIFGFWDLDTNENLILNHLLLIFKMYIYNARTRGYLNVSHLLVYIKSIKDIEKKLCENDAKRRKKFIKKWENILIEDN